MYKGFKNKILSKEWKKFYCRKIYCLMAKRRQRPVPFSFIHREITLNLQARYRRKLTVIPMIYMFLRIIYVWYDIEF